MFFFSSKLYFKLLSAFVLIFLFISANQAIYAQRSRTVLKKTETPRKTAGKKGEPQSKTEKNKKETSKKSETVKSKKETQTSSKKTTTAKSKKETQAELKKKAEDKKKAEAEAAKKRRQPRSKKNAAAIKQIRDAQAKKRELENSFRNETVANILKDDISGEDMEIRRAAINALGSRAGTVVVMEAQTGKILTMVNQDWAIRKSFKPCSTIKLVTAVAGLDKNLINSDGSIRDKRFRLDLTDALAYSNNSYFQLVGANLGSETMISYAKRLGLGMPTGINADDETAGRLPFGNNNARIYSHGDDYEVSPLQLGVMVSAISNGGKIIIPQIPKSKVQKTSFSRLFKRRRSLCRKKICKA